MATEWTDAGVPGRRLETVPWWPAEVPRAAVRALHAELSRPGEAARVLALRAGGWLAARRVESGSSVVETAGDAWTAAARVLPPEALAALPFDEAAAGVAADLLGPGLLRDRLRAILPRLGALAAGRPLLGRGARPALADADDGEPVVERIGDLLLWNQRAVALSLADELLARLEGRPWRPPDGEPDPLAGFWSYDPRRISAALDATGDRPPVRRPAAWRDRGVLEPVRGGLADARVFGSTYEDRCLCGALRDAPDEACGRCGVRGGDAWRRDATWSWIEVRAGVPHPALTERPTRVPVPPPGLRPRTWRPDDPPGAEEAAHPVDRALARLVHRAECHDRLVAFGAPRDSVEGEVLEVAEAFRELWSAVHDERPPTWDGWGAARPDRDPLDARWDGEAQGDGRGSAGVLWLDEERLVVQDGPDVRVLGPDGRVLAARRVGDLRISGAASGLVLLLHPHALDEVCVGLWRPDADRVERDWPDGLGTAVAWRDAGEDAELLDLRTGRCAELLPDAGRVDVAWTTDRRYAWATDDGVTGPIRDARTALRTAWAEAVAGVAADAVPIDVRGRTLRAPPDLLADDPPALALWRGEGWRVLTADRVVGVDGAARLRLGFPVRAAAFSPDGGALALIVAERLLLLPIDAPERVRELPLR